MRITLQRAALIPVIVAAFVGGGALASLFGLRECENAPATLQPALQLYAEALTQIEQRALFANGVGTRQDIVTASLKAYLAQMDTYSDFLSREENAKFKEANNPSQAGIGL